VRSKPASIRVGCLVVSLFVDAARHVRMARAPSIRGTDEVLGEGMSEHERLARELRLAAGRGEILAQYQPQVALQDGHLVALEALSRWRHPKRGLMPPREFIPLAEASGSVGLIGDAMLDEACRFGAALARAGRRIEIAVNVAAAQLAADVFVEKVAGCLARWGLPAHLLTVELTETRPSPAGATRLLARARRIGVGVSIDDVRTAEEAERRMRDLPVTELKVDRSVIARLPHDREVAAELVAMARDLGLRTVAEGVETWSQLVAVRELGFDRAQGYLLGRPVSARRIMARLIRGNAFDAAGTAGAQSTS
jgi:EAL domain-containing protein (putative c-di-GMP-specific phosphodiesterase class I)